MGCQCGNGYTGKFDIGYFALEHSESVQFNLALDQELDVRPVALYWRSLLAAEKKIQQVLKQLRRFSLCEHIHADMQYDEEQLPYIALSVNTRHLSLSEGVVTQFRPNGFEVSSTNNFLFSLCVRDVLPRSILALLREIIRSIPVALTQARPMFNGARSQTRKVEVINEMKIDSSMPVLRNKIPSRKNVNGKKFNARDKNMIRISGHHGSAFLLFRLPEGACDQKERNRFLQKLSSLVKSGQGASGLKFYSKAAIPKALPDGSVGRVKLLGAHGNRTLAIFRAPTREDEDPLYYTGERIIRAH